MSRIHEKSPSTTLPLFDVFRLPPTQISVDKDILHECHPVSTISDNQPIVFEFNTSYDEFLILQESNLYLKLKMTLSKVDKSEVAEGDWGVVTPCNNLLHSLFSRVDISVNSQSLSMSPSNYAYRSYLEKFLGHAKSARKGYLSAALYREDADERKDYIKARGTDKKVSTIDLMDKLHLDLTFQDKALVGNLNVVITLFPNTVDFCFELPNTHTLKMEIIDPTLLIHKAKVTPKLLEGHSHGWKRGSSKYTVTRTEVKHMSILNGTTDKQIDLIRGQIPRRMFVMMVESTSFTGSTLKDPFKFDHFNINHLACYLDGVCHPYRPYEPNFTSRLYIKEFLALYQALNQNGTDTYMQIDRDAYADGNAIFAFNFTPDLSSGPGAIGHVNEIKRGEVRLHLKFSSALAKNVTLLLFLEYDNLIEIGQLGDVVNNFQ